MTQIYEIGITPCKCTRDKVPKQAVIKNFYVNDTFKVRYTTTRISAKDLFVIVLTSNSL